jgi:hypothetical protein
MSETRYPRCKRVSAFRDDEAALALAVREATGIEVPTLEPGAPAKLAARAQAEACGPRGVLPHAAAWRAGTQPLPAAAFPAWAIVASGVGLAAVALLARVAPLAYRFPGSLLVLVPGLNLLCSPVAAFALVQRRKQHAR